MATLMQRETLRTTAQRSQADSTVDKKLFIWLEHNYKETVCNILASVGTALSESLNTVGHLKLLFITS